MRVHYNTGKPVDVSKLDRVAQTLYRFGYDVEDAESLSRRIIANLDNYARQYDLAMERAIRSNGQAVRPTQTPYWKANNG